MADSSRIRAFLAVEVSPAIHAGLVALRSELESAGADVRWVRDGGLHATVKFLGSVSPAGLDVLRGSLEPLACKLAPVEARVRGLGVFPAVHRARVIWAGLDAPGLAPLAEIVDERAVQVGVAREERPFRPHVTLGRVRSPRGREALEEALKRHWSDDFGQCRITEIAGYKSDLRPGGAVYTKLWAVPLGGPHRNTESPAEGEGGGGDGIGSES